jgi:hypothetical protein
MDTNFKIMIKYFVEDCKMDVNVKNNSKDNCLILACYNSQN